MIKVIHEAYSGYLSFYYSQIRHDFYDAVVGYVIYIMYHNSIEMVRIEKTEGIWNQEIELSNESLLSNVKWTIFSYIIEWTSYSQWNDDEVRFVLVQHV